MDILTRLPKDVFEHAMNFYDGKTPTARAFGNFMAACRGHHHDIFDACIDHGVTDTCTQFSFLEDSTREFLIQFHLKHEKPVLIDWCMCGYQFGFENEDLVRDSAVRGHFSRLALVWDSHPLFGVTSGGA